MDNAHCTITCVPCPGVLLIVRCPPGASTRFDMRPSPRHTPDPHIDAESKPRPSSVTVSVTLFSSLTLAAPQIPPGDDTVDGVFVGHPAGLTVKDLLRAVEDLLIPVCDNPSQTPARCLCRYLCCLVTRPLPLHLGHTPLPLHCMHFLPYPKTRSCPVPIQRLQAPVP